MKIINLLIADDHPMIRNGVRLMLDNQTTYKFNISEASNGEETLASMKHKDFDVVILDISMKKMGGIEVLENLKQLKNSTPVIIQTMHDDLLLIKQTIDLGAKGYILKISDHDELLHAIENVLENKPYYSREISAILFSSFAVKSNKNKPDGLSNRELEILLLITEGYSNQQIADKLFISKRTVEGHKEKIYRKTSTYSTQSIIAYAKLQKLIFS